MNSLIAIIDIGIMPLCFGAGILLAAFSAASSSPKLSSQLGVLATSLQLLAALHMWFYLNLGTQDHYQLSYHWLSTLNLSINLRVDLLNMLPLVVITCCFFGLQLKNAQQPQIDPKKYFLLSSVWQLFFMTLICIESSLLIAITWVCLALLLPISQVLLRDPDSNTPNPKKSIAFVALLLLFATFQTNVNLFVLCICIASLASIWPFHKFDRAASSSQHRPFSLWIKIWPMLAIFSGIKILHTNLDTTSIYANLIIGFLATSIIACALIAHAQKSRLEKSLYLHHAIFAHIALSCVNRLVYGPSPDSLETIGFIISNAIFCLIILYAAQISALKTTDRRLLNGLAFLGLLGLPGPATYSANFNTLLTSLTASPAIGALHFLAWSVLCLLTVKYWIDDVSEASDG